MDTACLRIKFTPLLQEAQKVNSKCCLEIIPEVSCIQNLNKLTWKQETNFIEYNIPMTYKIILRKHNIKDNSEDTVKTYHSCVDLLLSSSQSEYNLASGDLSRIISDTFIISKVPTSSPKFDHKDLITNTPDSHNGSDITQGNVNNVTTNTTSYLTDSIVKETEAEQIIEDITKIEPLQGQHSHTLTEISSNKTTNTELNYPIITNDLLFQELKNIANKLPSKRRLSLSPICSINTVDKDVVIGNITSNNITCDKLDSDKVDAQVQLGHVSSQSEISSEYHAVNLISPAGRLSIESSIKSVFFSFGDRPPPEIRVAQYVRYMEQELSPLNTVLDNLISKCSSLGLPKVPSTKINAYFNNNLLYNSNNNSLYMCKNQNSQETCEKSESNRAVYTIVFDG